MARFAPRNTARAQDLRREATPAERKLWRYLNARQLDGFKFSRQMPVGPYFCDLLCRSAKLAVELDGPSHEYSEAEDERRTRFLESQGFTVVRFTNAEVFENAEGVVETIRRYLANTPTPNPSRKREGNS